MNRKELKSEARKVLKSHYLICAAICLLALLCTSAFVRQDRDNLVKDYINRKIGLEEKGENILSLSDDTIRVVIDDIYQNNIDQAREDVDDALNSYQESQNTGILGRTQGIFAKVVNSVTSGEILVVVFDSISSFVHNPRIAGFFMILLALGFELIVITFFKNMVSLIMPRIFMEAGTYEKVPFQHVFYFDSVNKWVKSALAYMRYELTLLLWYLTIVGGFIKTYSYAMVPYILAENPDISGKDAMALSRKMMDGHKLELFQLDLSMAGWFALDYLTIGLSGVFWSNPYYSAIVSQFYRRLRAQCIEAGMEGIEVLNDVYLFEQPDDEALARAYRDVKMDQMYIRDNSIELTGIQKFFVENFSIWIGSAKKKNTYQAIESIRAQIENDQEVLEKKAYPDRLSPLYIRARKHFSGQKNHVRAYTIQSLVLIFFAFAIIGWIWEVCLYLLTDGVFVNRGTMMGPYLPIYGAGAVIALILLSKLRRHPVWTFAGSMVLSGVIEFATSYVLEKMYGLRWWDYTGYFLNLDGRICLEGLILFGIGCMIAIYLVAPELDSRFARVDSRILSGIALVMTLVFGCDAVYSAKHPNTGDNIASGTSALPSLSDTVS
ncbi:MAG: DUF975 family protein [Bulleidia sp.]